MDGIIDQIPSEKGTYILFLHLDTDTSIRVGKLGTFDFSAEWYAYIGSAFGRGGLRGRLKHHLRPVNKPHWHIDYLRQYAPVRETWTIVSEIVYEHRLAELLLDIPQATIPVVGFGASDCRCDTHLLKFLTMIHCDVLDTSIADDIERISVT